MNRRGFFGFLGRLIPAAAAAPAVAAAAKQPPAVAVRDEDFIVGPTAARVAQSVWADTTAGIDWANVGNPGLRLP